MVATVLMHFSCFDFGCLSWCSQFRLFNVAFKSTHRGKFHIPFGDAMLLECNSSSNFHIKFPNWCGENGKINKWKRIVGPCSSPALWKGVGESNGKQCTSTFFALLININGKPSKSKLHHRIFYLWQNLKSKYPHPPLLFFRKSSEKRISILG